MGSKNEEICQQDDKDDKDRYICIKVTVKKIDKKRNGKDESRKESRYKKEDDKRQSAWKEMNITSDRAHDNEWRWQETERMTRNAEFWLHSNDKTNRKTTKKAEGKNRSVFIVYSFFFLGCFASLRFFSCSFLSCFSTHFLKALFWVGREFAFVYSFFFSPPSGISTVIWRPNPW